MAKRNGKVNSVTSAKNYLIDVPDESIVIIIPRTTPSIPHEKKRRKTTVEEIYMKRVAMAKAIEPSDNNNSDDGENDFAFDR